MAEILDRIQQVYDEAVESGISPEHVVISLSSNGLSQLIDALDENRNASELLNKVHLNCEPSQKSDVVLGRLPPQLSN